MAITDVLFPAYVDGLPPEPRAPLREADAGTVLGEWDAG